MQQHLFFSDDPLQAISPMLELGAYERLWLDDKRPSFPKLARIFRDARWPLPSELVALDPADSLATARDARQSLLQAGITDFGVRLPAMIDYPNRLRDAQNPVELLYFRGDWALVESPLVAVVGTRQASAVGLRQARKIAGGLAADGWTIVSGLADGIDTAAHEAAVAAGGRTIAVLGTPLSVRYPAKNSALLEKIAREHLVLSQVPVLFYKNAPHQERRGYFVERNATMSALAKASIIVEAGETSGTLHQARAALAQGRQLLILDSCFRSAWPHPLVERGAIRVRDVDEIRERLQAADSN